MQELQRDKIHVFLPVPVTAHESISQTISVFCLYTRTWWSGSCHCAYLSVIAWPDCGDGVCSSHCWCADERWQRVSKRLDQFVKSYPKTWDRCLEAFMVPLRISLPPQADYVPAYLTFNRYVHIVRLMKMWLVRWWISCSFCLDH